MARDQYAAAAVAKIHPRFRTPARMTVITGLLVTVLSAVFPLPDLLALTNIGTLVALRSSAWGAAPAVPEPDAQRPFRAPLLPFFSVAGGARVLF